MPLLHACRPARRSTGRLRVALTTSVLAVALTGCTDGAQGNEDSGPEVGVAVGTTLEVRTSVSRVAGALSRGQRSRIEEQVGQLLERHLSAAYLHERPGGGYRGSFPGFTRGARELAMRDLDTASDKALRGADEVRPRAAVAFVSVVAPEGRPAGATARVFLDLHVLDGDRKRLREVRGRLLLTPARGGWRIFGYDLTLNEGKRGPRK